MKIRIKTEDTKLNLRLPSSLMYSSLTFKIIEKAIEKETGVRMNKDTSDKVRLLLKKAVKKYKGLNLVEVHSADGEIVEITL